MVDEKTLRTPAGDFPLDEYCFKLAEGELKILHVSAVLTGAEETDFIRDLREHLPYGVTLWAAAIALAHEIAASAESFNRKRVLELGAGTGLPGIVAASFGAEVTQTDRDELVMSLSRRNLELNGALGIEQRYVDWNHWNEPDRYDWIIGSDILYNDEMHHALRRIFETNLAAGGRILLSDPFRKISIEFLEELEASGWSITMSKWNIGAEPTPRPVGVFVLAKL